MRYFYLFSIYTYNLLYICIEHSCYTIIGLVIHSFIYIYIYIYIYKHNIYVYIYKHNIYIYKHKVHKSHRSKMGVIYMQFWKQCALPVITAMTLCQLIHLVHDVRLLYYSSISCAQMHELPQNHCGNNREGTLFSWGIHEFKSVNVL